MSVTRPVVSVVIPVYNAGEFLREAIESILHQSFQDFELIAINDGSTDDSADILFNYQRQEPRLQVYTQSNQGSAVARNLGCQKAQGKYVAFLDADDISLQDRLLKQVKFLESNPDIGILGSAFKITHASFNKIFRHPLEDSDIRAALFFDSAFATSTVMLRRSILSEFGLCFDRTFKLAQDYQLWVSATNCCKLANLPEVLVIYRKHDSQITNQSADKLLYYAGRVRRAQLEKLDIHPSDEEFLLHQALCTGKFENERIFLEKSRAWLENLMVTNSNKHFLPEPAFSKILGKRWYYACISSTELGWWSWKMFWESPLSQFTGIKIRQKVKFALRSALSH